MSTTPTTITPGASVRSLQRFSNTVGAGIFLLVQRFPRLLKFQRSENSWSVFRLILGCFGAALVVLPLSFWIGWVTGIVTPLVGMFFFVASILLPPPETESDTDRKARELGATTMVNGGEYQPGNAPRHMLGFFSPGKISGHWTKISTRLWSFPLRRLSSVFVDSLSKIAGYCISVGKTIRPSFPTMASLPSVLPAWPKQSIRSLLPGSFSGPLKRSATAS